MPLLFWTMDNWNNIPIGGVELTIESEAYLELAKDDLLKYEYNEALKDLEVAVRSANSQAEYLMGWMHVAGLYVGTDFEKTVCWMEKAA